MSGLIASTSLASLGPLKVDLIASDFNFISTVNAPLRPLRLGFIWFFQVDLFVKQTQCRLRRLTLLRLLRTNFQHFQRAQSYFNFIQFQQNFQRWFSTISTKSTPNLIDLFWMTDFITAIKVVGFNIGSYGTTIECLATFKPV